MSLAQPSRTIVVEPVQVPKTASAPAEPPLDDAPRQVEPPGASPAKAAARA